MSQAIQVGQTPMVVIDGVHVKLECSNPTGSIKDRIAAFMLSEARRRGELRDGDVVVEATSGNTGIAMSAAARALGHPVIIFMPESMSAERRQMIEALGAEVRLTPAAGGFEQPIEERDAFRGRPGYHVPDQFANPDNTRCHLETTGPELIAQLRAEGIDRLDAFVAGIGTGGTLMGVGQALRAVMPDVRIVAVEPAESAVLSGGPPGDHGIQGIGDGFVPDLVDVRFLDAVECIETADAKAACDRIREDHGYCVGMSSGANMLAAVRQLESHGGPVATVWPDCSDRYGSMGLQSPSSEAVHCPFRATCAERGRELLGR